MHSVILGQCRKTQIDGEFIYPSLQIWQHLQGSSRSVLPVHTYSVAYESDFIPGRYEERYSSSMVSECSSTTMANNGGEGCMEIEFKIEEIKQG